MFRVASLEFGFDARVVVAPKAGEVGGDLDGFHPWSEDVDDDRDTIEGDARRALDVVELLDSQGDEGYLTLEEVKLWSAAVG